MSAPTLTGALAALGYTHRRADLGPNARPRHDIIDATGNVVATLCAREAWWFVHDVTDNRARGLPDFPDEVAS